MMKVPYAILRCVFAQMSREAASDALLIPGGASLATGVNGGEFEGGPEGSGNVDGKRYYPYVVLRQQPGLKNSSFSNVLQSVRVYPTHLSPYGTWAVERVNVFNYLSGDIMAPLDLVLRDLDSEGDILSSSIYRGYTLDLCCLRGKNAVTDALAYSIFVCDHKAHLISLMEAVLPAFGVILTCPQFVELAGTGSGVGDAPYALVSRGFPVKDQLSFDECRARTWTASADPWDLACNVVRLFGLTLRRRHHAP